MMKARSAALATVVVGAGSFAAIVSGASPSAADTLSPSGCLTQANGGGSFAGTPNWGSNCQVGYGLLEHNHRMVFAVQSFLQSTTYYTGSLDCEFGPQTYNAVKQFQRSVGLADDGVVGASTWKKMQSQLVAVGPDGTSTFIGYRSGLDGSGVRFWQLVQPSTRTGAHSPGDWSLPGDISALPWMDTAPCI